MYIYASVRVLPANQIQIHLFWNPFSITHDFVSHALRTIIQRSRYRLKQFLVGCMRLKDKASPFHHDCNSLQGTCM